MNKAEMLKFLEMFNSGVELFILTGGRRVPIKILTYELSDDSTGRVLIEPEYIAKPGLIQKDSERFLLWADGSCSGNPGPGGWAYFLSAFSIIDGKYDNMRTNKSSGYHEGSTTNNGMELEAVIEGLYAAH